jgi:hypothetical protein
VSLRGVAVACAVPAGLGGACALGLVGAGAASTLRGGPAPRWDRLPLSCARPHVTCADSTCPLSVPLVSRVGSLLAACGSVSDLFCLQSCRLWGPSHLCDCSPPGVASVRVVSCVTARVRVRALHVSTLGVRLVGACHFSVRAACAGRARNVCRTHAGCQPSFSQCRAALTLVGARPVAPATSTDTRLGSPARLWGRNPGTFRQRSGAPDSSGPGCSPSDNRVCGRPQSGGGRARRGGLYPRLGCPGR